MIFSLACSGGSKRYRAALALICLSLFAPHFYASVSAQSTSPRNDTRICIAQWRRDRGLTSDDVPDQSTLPLVRFILRNVPSPTAANARCANVYLVLDRVRSQAATHSSGTVEVSVSEKQNKAVTTQGKFSLVGDKLKATGKDITLTGTLSHRTISGDIRLAGVTGQVTAPIEIGAGTTDSMKFGGLISSPLNGMGNNAPISIVLRTTTKGEPLPQYISQLAEVLPASSMTAEYSCSSCPGAQSSSVLKDLVDWATSVFTASIGYLSIGPCTLPDVQIFVDGELVAPLPSEIPLKADSPHTIQVDRASAIVLTVVVRPRINQVVSWNVPMLH